MRNIKNRVFGFATAILVLAGAGNVFGADLQVPADHTSIQAAVDAASSGDTIHIAAGVYVEQTTISNKDLTLIGQPGTILRAFPNMERPWPTVNWSRTILLANSKSQVTIHGLTFEGDQLAGDQFDSLTGQSAPGLRGVWIDGSGGSVEDCRFTGFRERTPGSSGSCAIFFWNGFDGADRYVAHVSNTTIEDSYEGIVVVGAPDKISYNFTIENNTIRGVATSATAAQNRRGMELSEGITGFVLGNSISGFSYTGTGAQYPHAWGIIAVGLGPSLPETRPVDFIRFENNTFRDNNQHLMLIRAKSHEIVNNQFEGTGQGERPSGLWFSGENVLVQGNTFSDMEEAIRAGGVDPTYGTDLGIATNATLVDNRFCNVTTSINQQPQATVTEQGTLFCPPPDPVLTISWPVINEGFSLQSAPAPSGPWTTSEAAVHQQGVKNTVVLPADSDEQFFRLTNP